MNVASHGEWTHLRFKTYAGLYGGKTPHGLPADRRLTGEKLLHLAQRDDSRL